MNQQAIEQSVEHELPFGIQVSSADGNWQIISGLSEHFLDPNESENADLESARGEAAADGMESLILALAAEGYDLSAPAFIRALETAVQQTGINL